MNTPPMWRGCLLIVYRRSGGDSSGGGITTRANKLSLVGLLRHDLGAEVEPVRGPTSPDRSQPAVILAGRDGDAYLTPAVYEDGQWKLDCTSFWIDGGNFARGSGPEWQVAVARFQLPGAVAIRVHDRFETDPWEV